MQNRIWAFLLAFIVGMGVTVGFSGSAKADAGGATGRIVDVQEFRAVAAKAATVPQPRLRTTRASVSFTNANEASVPDTKFRTRLFIWRGEQWRAVSSFAAALSAGEDASILSRRFSYRGQYKLRGETRQNGVLVASKEISGSGGIPLVHMVWGSYEDGDGPPAQQGGLKLSDSIAGISFSKVQLVNPTTNAVMFEYVFVKVSETDTSAALSTGEQSGLIAAPLGTFKVQMMTTESTPRLFVFANLVNIGSTVVELDARID